jgi:hypothetical protein
VYANLYCVVWFGPAGAIILVIRPPHMHQGPVGASGVGTLPAALPGPKCPDIFSGSGMTGAIMLVICLPPMHQGPVGASAVGTLPVLLLFVFCRVRGCWGDNSCYPYSSYAPRVLRGRVFLAPCTPPFLYLYGRI